jgi:CBS domain-containing protein
MRINDLMTPAPVCCKPQDSLVQVAEIMRHQNCGSIPVCDAMIPVGIITDRDIVCRAVAMGRDVATTRARDVMTREVHCVRETDFVEQAVSVMKSHQVRRLPVVNDDGVLVGIVAASDLAPTFASNHDSDFLLAVSYWQKAPLHTS